MDEVITESVVETSTVKCTYCYKTCIRILKGYYPNEVVTGFYYDTGILTKQFSNKF